MLSPFAPHLAVGPMLTCALLLCALSLQAQAPAGAAPGAKVGTVLSCGHWEPSFQHDLTGFPPILPRFNAAHVAVIPKGPQRGKVLTWDIRADAATPEWKQRWSIVDPAAPGGPTFLNYELSMPADEGDLFCAGLAWTSAGDLLVVGGTTNYPALVAESLSSAKSTASATGGASSNLVASTQCSSGAQGCCTTIRGPTGTPTMSNCGGCGDGCGCGCFGSDGEGYLGGKLTYLWNPDDLGWYRQPDLALDRWYPTALNLADGKLLVAGGVAGGELGIGTTNNYEVFVLTGSNPPAGTWQTGTSGQLFDGPRQYPSLLYIYPRLHVLTTGAVFMGGMSTYSVKLDHDSAPGVWIPGEKATYGLRIYGSTALMPYVPDALGNYADEVLILGGIGLDFPTTGSRARSSAASTTAPGSIIGGPFTSHGALRTVEVSNPTASDQSWRSAPSMLYKRKYANAVLLPDGSLLVVGGNSGSSDNQPAFEPELFDGTSWTVLPPIDARRTYHSTAALLPDGRVLSAGGNSATSDYQVFVPSYLCGGDPRPVITSSPATMGYYAENPLVHTIAFDPLPVGHSVERAVLITPCSTTHHTDYNQRYVQLILESSAADHLDVRAPADRNLVPPGYYMLFLLSTAGVPSEAAWVKVE